MQKSVMSLVMLLHIVVAVEAASRASCDSARRQMALVGGQSGYLSGVWAAETGCGTVDAPWHVRVQPGQRINVTLFDFAVPSSTNNRTSSADVHSDTVSAGTHRHHVPSVRFNSTRYTDTRTPSVLHFFASVSHYRCHFIVFIITAVIFSHSFTVLSPPQANT